MSGTTPRMGLKTFDSSDPFLRQDFNDNASKLDASPGVFLCTSASRPAWGASQAGMRIYESDTRRELVWTGTAWREVLTAPPAWSGYIRPNVSLSNDAHVYYKMATFNVTRPGSLFITLVAELACQSIYGMQATLRPQMDGNDCQVGDSGSFVRMEQVHTSGNGWSRHPVITALGLHTVGVGSHNFGTHFYTTPDNTSAHGTMSLISVRAVALLVNSTDT